MLAKLKSCVEYFRQLSSKEKRTIIALTIVIEILLVAILLSVAGVIQSRLEYLRTLSPTNDVLLGEILSNEIYNNGTFCIVKIKPPIVQVVDGETYSGKVFTQIIPLPDYCQNMTVGKCLWGNKHPARLYVLDCNEINVEFSYNGRTTSNLQ
jgi:hypothetical protein